MISDVDIRDWEFKIKDAKAAVRDVDVAAYQEKSLELLQSFIEDVEKLVKGKQPQVAALFKEKK